MFCMPAFAVVFITVVFTTDSKCSWCYTLSATYRVIHTNYKYGFRLTASLTTKIGENVIDVHFGI